MGLVNSLSSFYGKMKAAALGDDKYGAEEDYDLYEEEYEEYDDDMKVVPPKKERRERASRHSRPPLDPINPGRERGDSRTKARGGEAPRSVGGVVQMPGTAPRGNNIVIVTPSSIDDCDEICTEVREGAAVALNLEGVEHGSAQRIVDFCAGVVAAVDGEIREAADKVFIVAPRNFMITGQSREILRKAGIVLPYDGR